MTLSFPKHMLAAAAALVLAPGNAGAASVTVFAGQGTTNISETTLDGSVAEVAVDEGQGSASASGTPTSLAIAGADTTHFSVGAPGSGGNTDAYFSVQGGGGGPISLTFHFVTTGGWTLGDPATFTAGGGFTAFVESSTGKSPQVIGGFNTVNCVGCGGRLTGGGITTIEDFYGPGAVNTVTWEGANPGEYYLTSTFLGGVLSAGRLRLNANGGVGNASYDFSIFLQSITTDGPSNGLTVLLDSGQSINVGAAVPEPATWALLLTGFGLSGAMLRRRRRPAVTA